MRIEVADVKRRQLHFLSAKYVQNLLQTLVVAFEVFDIHLKTGALNGRQSEDSAIDDGGKFPLRRVYFDIIQFEILDRAVKFAVQPQFDSCRAADICEIIQGAGVNLAILEQGAHAYFSDVILEGCGSVVNHSEIREV